MKKPCDSAHADTAFVIFLNGSKNLCCVILLLELNNAAKACLRLQ